MRTRAIWILVGFCIASLVYSIMIGCGKKTPNEANANGNGVVRKVYSGTAVDTTGGGVWISVPEMTLDDPPAIVYYSEEPTAGQWQIRETEIEEGKIEVLASDAGRGYKIVVIK